jgi:hypothetical protein
MFGPRAESDWRDFHGRRISPEPGDVPLVNGIPAKLGRGEPELRRLVQNARANQRGRLKAYGNAIVPDLAAQFIRSFVEGQEEMSDGAGKNGHLTGCQQGGTSANGHASSDVSPVPVISSNDIAPTPAPQFSGNADAGSHHFSGLQFSAQQPRRVRVGADGQITAELREKGHDDLFQSYSVADLERFARGEYDRITSSEVATAKSYWLLGEWLRGLRKAKNIAHGEWMDYVTKTLGFDYQRVKRALRIRRKHDDMEIPADKTLLDALGYRQEDDENIAEEAAQPTNASRNDDPSRAGAVSVPSRNGAQQQDRSPNGSLAGGPNAGGAPEEPFAEPFGTRLEQPPKVPDADLNAAAAFIEVTGGGKQAAGALVMQVAKDGDKEPVKDILRGTVAAARSVLQWGEIQAVVTAAQLKAHGAIMEEL